MNRYAIHTAESRPVTVTFDAEDIVDTLKTLESVICPQNLAAVGRALADSAEHAKRAS